MNQDLKNWFIDLLFEEGFELKSQNCGIEVVLAHVQEEQGLFVMDTLTWSGVFEEHVEQAASVLRL